MNHLRRYAPILLAVLAVIAAAPAGAQGGEIVLSLAVPEFFEDVFNDELMAAFEAQHPDVRVNVIGSSGAFTGSPAYNLDEYMESMEAYVSAADVVFVNTNSLSPEATRAGYFLDLSPLTSADPTLNAEDFIPATWQAFQWDRAVWALPVAADVILLIYNPKAFDEAGIPYPNAAWTLDDFANAARVLTTTNADGEKQPAYVDYGNSEHLFRSLLGMPLYDVNTAQPDFSNPALESMLTTWQELRAEGVIDGLGGDTQIVIIGAGSDGPAMSIQQSFGLASFPGSDSQPLAGALLPGGKAALEVQGFAVSAGTQYQEQAYALAKFLTNSIDVADGLIGGIPARQSLAGQESQGESQTPFGDLDFTPENQAVIDQAFANAMSDTLFSEYLNVALNKMESHGIDARTALLETELEAVNNLAAAEQKRNEITVSVATPVPQVVLGAGEVALNFGLTSFVSPLPNQDLWNQIIDDFVAADPQVGQIVMDTDFSTDLSEMAGKYDCFYLPTNVVGDDDLSAILPLDPYIDADPTFDKSDVVGTTLQQVQFDNKTWALPVVLQPEVLRYNSDLFAQAGVPLPENGWTVDAFTDALEALKRIAAEGTQPFVPRGFGSNYLMALIAAYGGLPIDTRTTPATISFTDPATLDAIRQVLDLVKAGYIKYEPLAARGGARMIFAVGGAEDRDAIYTHSLNGLSFVDAAGDQGAGDDPYRLVTYPQGSQYTPVSYNIGTAYISAASQNPEACYRWISILAQHPELFSGMPARRSLINNPAGAANHNPDLLAVFNQLADLLAQPNVINLPTGFGGTPETTWLQTWLNRAFDRYVLEGADLETELAQAESYAREYQQCSASIPPYDEAQTRQVYFQQFFTCATQVDPTVAG